MTKNKSETKEKQKTENKVNPKTFSIVLIIIITLFSLFIISSEYTLNTGEKVLLKTIPVDPRDLLRGDYVILRYEIQNNDAIINLIKNKNLTTGDTFYISLNKDENTNLGTFKEVTITKPNTGIFIKTEIINKNQFELGIGKYFVPEGKGRQIERLTGEIQVQASIDKYGTAIIKDLYHKGERFEFQKEEK